MKKNLIITTSLAIFLSFYSSPALAKQSFAQTLENAQELLAELEDIEISAETLACAIYEVQLLEELPQDPSDWVEIQRVMKAIKSEIARFCPDVSSEEREKSLILLQKALIEKKTF